MSLEVIRSRFAALLQGDKFIWLIATLLALVSILVVYSSSEALAMRQNAGTESFLVKHVVILVSSMVLMYVCHNINFTRYSKYSKYMLIAAIIMLAYTLLFGANINGAARWIKIPFIGITVQTSDFAKVALIMYVARTLALMQEAAADPKNPAKQISLSELVLPILMVCGLIAPVDLSTALSLFFTCMLLMIIGSANLRDIFSLLMLGLGLFACLVALEDYIPAIRVKTWESRVSDFFTAPADLTTAEMGGQVIQAKMAIAKGGLLGAGPGNGTQAHFLPHAYSDYIFCIIIEEYGFIGAVAVLALYLMLLLRCIRLVTKSPKAFGSMLAIGFCLAIIVQAFIHMSVNVSLVPVTGLTLPFVSMGGTSLIFTGIMFGIILSVSRYIETTANPEDLAAK
jgi:cell division protein FtsW